MAQQEDSALAVRLKTLKQECEAAPRYGLNGRELILQAARLVAQAEPYEVAPSRQSAQTSLASAQPRRQEQQAYCSGGTLLDAVPANERPFAPFVARSFMPQALRQECVNRLAGQYLALLLQQLGVADDKAVATVKQDAEIRKAASEAALAQELRMYKGVTNKLAYQALVWKTDASLEFVSQQQLGALRAMYGQQGPNAADAASAEVAGQLQPECEAGALQHPTPEDQHHQQQQQQCMQGQHEHSAANNEAADEPPVETLGTSDADHAEPQHPAKRARLMEPVPHPHGHCQPASTSHAAGSLCNEQASTCQQMQAPSDQQAGAPQDAMRNAQLEGLLSSLFEDGQQAAGGEDAGASSSPGNTQHQGQTPLAGAAPRTAEPVPLSAPAAAPAATPAAAQASPASMDEDAIRQQVRQFVAAIARPLVKSGVIDGQMFELVVARGVAKVLQRHAEAQDANFLLKECRAITKLVMSYVDFYRSRQRPDG